MPSIHIFNPDSEYALASGRRYYTPPAHVAAIRRKMQLIPLLYARENDIVLVEDKDIPEDRKLEASAKGIGICDYNELKECQCVWATHTPDPWGWNMSIRQFFIDLSSGKANLPSEQRMNDLRILSHRRTAKQMLEIIPSELRKNIEIPTEVTNVESAIETILSQGPFYVKAPWSSSGRGILYTYGLQRFHIEPWIRGIVRRQESVMLEKAYDRKLDFATEWVCKSGKAEFLGVSVFNTSRRGKYHGNIIDSQNALRKLIQSNVTINLNEVIEAQKYALEQMISPRYDGPLGIDMLATSDGDVHPCVELNLRHTMGMIGLL